MFRLIQLLLIKLNGAKILKARIQYQQLFSKTNTEPKACMSRSQLSIYHSRVSLAEYQYTQGCCCNPPKQVVSPLTSRRSVRPGLNNRFLRVGPSSGPHLPREDRAGWHHIGGHEVELTLYRHSQLPCCTSSSVLNFHCVLELCSLYSKLLCKTVL